MCSVIKLTACLGVFSGGVSNRPQSKVVSSDFRACETLGTRMSALVMQFC